MAPTGTCHEAMEAAADREIARLHGELARLRGEIERMRSIYEAARHWHDALVADVTLNEGFDEMVSRLGADEARRILSESDAALRRAEVGVMSAVKAAGPRP